MGQSTLHLPSKPLLSPGVRKLILEVNATVCLLTKTRQAFIIFKGFDSFVCLSVIKYLRNKSMTYNPESQLYSSANGSCFGGDFSYYSTPSHLGPSRLDDKFIISSHPSNVPRVIFGLDLKLNYT